MAYTWAPDYSSFIDLAQYPGAQWMAANAGGGSEGAAPTAAGWYTGGGYNADSGGMNPYTSVGALPPDYWSLKNAGLWNLQDPNSDTWKFLQASGGGGDVKTDINDFARALMYGGQLGQSAFSRDAQGRAQVEGAYKEALNGLDPDFVNRFSDAIGGATEGYWEASKQAEGQGAWKDIDDTAVSVRDLFMTTPLGVALAAATGGAIYGAMGEAGFGAAASGATAGGIVGGGSSILNGGNFEDVLKGAGTGALGGAAGGALFGGTGGTAGMPVGPDGMPMGGSFGGSFGGVPEAPSGVWGGGDPSEFIGDFTTNPSLADLGGVIDPATGFPIGSPSFSGGLGSLTGPQTGTVQNAPVINAPTPPELAVPSPLADLASGGGTMPQTAPPQPATLADLAATPPTGANPLTPAQATSPVMPPAVPETPYDLSNQGLFNTGPGQFEQLPMTAGGAGSFQGINGLGTAATVAAGGTAAASGGGTSSGDGGGTPAPGSPLSRILSGEGTLADYLSAGGTLGGTALGVYGANQQTQAYTDLANKYMAMGAPYRDRLAGLYANPSSYLSSSEVQVPVQQGTDALARALSIKGNPAGSGTALQELQNYSANQLYGRLGEEKNRLAGFGGLTAYNAAAPGAAGAAIGSQGGVYNAIGYGLGQLTNPPSSLEQTLRSFRGGLGGLT